MPDMATPLNSGGLLLVLLVLAIAGIGLLTRYATRVRCAECDRPIGDRSRYWRIDLVGTGRGRDGALPDRVDGVQAQPSPSDAQGAHDRHPGATALSCTWCGHPAHPASGCPRDIQVAAHRIGGRRWAGSPKAALISIPCPCAAGEFHDTAVRGAA